MTSFSDFGLAAPILKALEGEGYTTPTPIQAQTIAPGIEGKDILGIAQTGTGKTAAFALPILHRLSLKERVMHPKGCRVLVLAPTRELAGQIADSFKVYGRLLKLTTEVIYGGVGLGRQEQVLSRGVDILVATPGRLLDLIDRGALTLKHVDVLVLDEADQMLDLGFIHALKRIVRLLPKQRQTLFFSATMPKTISGLAEEYLSNPIKVAVTPVATTAERVEQRVMFVPQARKAAVLRAVLADPAIERTLVFTRTKHGADKVVRQLTAGGIESAAIHGNKSQNQRERALGAFKSGKCRVLIATDIAARGIDVDGVSHVFNFDLPNVPESYVHRIGRTARAGADGIAISFCADDERPFLRDIERLTRMKVPVFAAPEGLDDIVVPDLPRGPQQQRGEGGRNGGGRGGNGGRSGGQRSGQPARNEGQRTEGGHGRPAQGRPAQGRTDSRNEGRGERSPAPASAGASDGRAARGGGRFDDLVARIGENGQRSGGRDNAPRGNAGGGGGGRPAQGQGRSDGRGNAPAGANRERARNRRPTYSGQGDRGE